MQNIAEFHIIGRIGKIDAAKEVTHASKNAMGTGPYKLVASEPGVKTVHEKNPDWWGIKEGRFEGNADRIEYRPIANAATRMAALKSGEIDLVLDPSVKVLSLIHISEPTGPY